MTLAKHRDNMETKSMTEAHVEAQKEAANKSDSWYRKGINQRRKSWESTKAFVR